MSKIKSIHINNFKFFRQSSPIQLDGKNLLLYGENGSGKSSVYYGLYTLLQASSKQVADVQKYFRPDNRETLVNIYADIAAGPEHTGSYLSVEDTGGHVYKLSYSETDCMSDPNLLESNRASDFMNYVSLFRFQLFSNSEPVDLHDVFKLTILPFLSFPAFEFQGKQLRGAEDMHRSYKAGPGKTHNPQGKEILVYKNSPEYANFQALETHFNDQMQNLINYINANVYNKILQFDYDFKVELKYIPAEHKKNETWIDYFKPYSILLRITEYNGKAVTIEHPGTFLNEAKMTALAFCIRWAILDYRLQAGEVPEAMKVLVLDDIMISLDMANRNKLINIIINDLSTKYQILFLTHDMQLFNSMKEHLKFKYNIDKEEKLIEKDWILQEIFEVERESGNEPIFQSSSSYYQRAKRYFDGEHVPVDMVASGNAIRQAFEGLFKTMFIRANITTYPNGKPIDINSLMIGSCIAIAKANKDQLGITDEELAQFESLRQCLLNPSSHHNPARNFYRQEIREAFVLYNIFSKFDFREVVPKGAPVEFAITLDSGEVHNYTVVLQKSILAYRFLSMPTFAIHWIPCKLTIEDSTSPGIIHKEHGISLKQIFEDSWNYHIANGKVPAANMPTVEDAITFNGQKLRDILNQF